MSLVSDEPLVISSPLYISGSECGYCHDNKSYFLGLKKLPEQAEAPKSCTHITVGSYVEQMTTSHYGKFMDHGFRRLGQFLYKGDMLRGCCRMFTIRTDISYLKITKEHRQCVNRFKRAISDKPEEKTATKNHPPFELRTLIEAEQNSSRFRTRFEPSEFSEEKFELYKKYQIHVHNDSPEDVTESQFINFLCKTPFLDEEVEGTPEQWKCLNSWVTNWKRGEKLKSPKRLGPTHECYYLDDKLIAFSILDFLHTGLSSIYFVWDPDYANLSLGTLLGIREIQMCHELGIRHYYLGYFIEDCPKMRYKAKFGGELLDVCNERFVPLDEIGGFLKDGQFFVTAKATEQNATNNDRESDILEGTQELRQTAEKRIMATERGVVTTEGGPIIENSETFEVFTEPELHLNTEPKTWKGNVINICERLYGDKYVYEEAEKAASILKGDYGITGLKIPLVFPGAIPMYFVLKWFQTGVVDLDFHVQVFSPFSGLRHSKIGSLNPKVRGAVVDCLRLYGVEMLRDSIIIVQ